jgi:hypothetical protein
MGRGRTSTGTPSSEATTVRGVPSNRCRAVSALVLQHTATATLVAALRPCMPLLGLTCTVAFARSHVHQLYQGHLSATSTSRRACSSLLPQTSRPALARVACMDNTGSSTAHPGGQALLREHRGSLASAWRCSTSLAGRTAHAQHAPYLASWRWFATEYTSRHCNGQRGVASGGCWAGWVQ